MNEATSKPEPTSPSREVRAKAQSVLQNLRVLKNQLSLLLLALTDDIPLIGWPFDSDHQTEVSDTELRGVLRNRLLKILPDNAVPHEADIPGLRQKRSLLVGCLVHIVTTKMNRAAVAAELEDGGVRGFYNRIPKSQIHPARSSKVRIVVEPDVQDYCRHHDGERVMLFGVIESNVLLLEEVRPDDLHPRHLELSSPPVRALPKPD